MKLFDIVISSLIIGCTFPLLFGLLSITMWFYFDKIDDRVIFYMFAGLLSGLLVDVFFLKYWVRNRFNLPLWFIAGIYVFYNVCIYGFFMGVPVFNTLMGLIAGYYFGNRICFNKIQSEMQSKQIKRVSLFTGFIMALICVSSGTIGLLDKATGNNIQGMLGLDFQITRNVLVVIIVTGGFSLIITQYFLTRFTMTKAINICSK